MLTKKLFDDGLKRLYGAFNKSCSPAAAGAIYSMLGGDEAEADDLFFADAVGRLMHLSRLPDNVGLALANLWAEWKAARDMGGASAGASEGPEPCRHCGGLGWIKVFCTTRPGVAPAFVKCECNEDPKLAGLPGYTKESAGRIDGCALENPWASPGARKAWIEARKAAAGASEPPAEPLHGAGGAL